ncbi:hypothetical protein RchiOBHm_Chr6g0273411 [Rosa chinensis]|uniref:Uncharacterized protein n=1 Tax=Rosa chinensis TaxID=74649 RepID=A0A2P6PRH3_ROSCH|nr:hypothetical protein RchiOBHm_Chr6g0273411 [Rosa chinensis]
MPHQSLDLPLITDAASVSLLLTPPHLPRINLSPSNAASHHDFGLEIEASIKQGYLAVWIFSS